MNRRSFVKLMSAVPFVGLPSIAFSEPEKQTLNNRRAKYRQYLNLYADNSTGIAKQLSYINQKLIIDSWPTFDLALYGDYFKVNSYPYRVYPGFMFIVFTLKGKILEYQYINNGVSPNYEVVGTPIVETQIDINTKFARFKPESIKHVSLNSSGDPYGTSLLEQARIAKFENGQGGDLTSYVKAEEFIQCANYHLKSNRSFKRSDWYC